MNGQSKHGFTLIELMIAMIAGAFAVAGVYYLNGVSSRSFAEQMRVSETQMSLRSAMEQLRRDFSRAGYLSTPNSRLIYDCGGTQNITTGIGNIAPRALQALRITANGSTDGTTTDTGAAVSTLLAPAANRTRADSVEVWGNYATPEVYLVDPVLSSEPTIVFQTTSEGFRRSFFEPAATNGPAVYGAAGQARFAAAFAPGRMVRLENGGRLFFRTITALNAAAASITLDTTSPGPLPGACFVMSDWTSIAPVVHLRYAVEPDSVADLSRLRSAATAGGTAPPGTRRTMLVRREFDNAATPAAIAGTARMVLDYAVEFSVDAFVNTADSAGAGLTPSWALQRGAAVTTTSSGATSITGPHQFRSLLVTLTARSVEVDPKLSALTRLNFNDPTLLDSPLMTFRVIDPNNATLVLNARTRTMRSEIFLLNQ